jgi:hypothetical protein
MLFSDDDVEPRARKIIEDHFFAETEKMIVKRLQASADTEQGRADLLRSTGIDDKQLIDEMAQLGITAEGVLALRLLPLVLVAWAQNHVDQDEHATVMAEAHRLGIEEDSVAWVLLDAWMRRLPPSKSIDAWKRYMHGIFKKISPVAQQKLIDATHQQMTAVAKASGGHLGLGKVSKQEKHMIDGLMLSLGNQTASEDG